jgi:hypothetical protein
LIKQDFARLQSIANTHIEKNATSKIIVDELGESMRTIVIRNSKANGAYSLWILQSTMETWGETEPSIVLLSDKIVNEFL